MVPQTQTNKTLFTFNLVLQHQNNSVSSQMKHIISSP
jgi:hypothetical protein